MTAPWPHINWTLNPKGLEKNYGIVDDDFNSTNNSNIKRFWKQEKEKMKGIFNAELNPEDME